MKSSHRVEVVLLFQPDRVGEGWSLADPDEDAPDVVVRIPAGAVWKMFTGGLSLADCERLAEIEGDR